MKRRKINKKVKGMTLIEIIISLAIFTLLALIMVRVGSVTKAMMMQTNHINKKTAAEAPIASVQDVAELGNRAASITDAEGNPTPMTVKSTPVTFTVQAKGSSVSSVVNSVKYSTEAAGEVADPNFDTNMRGDLEFYVVEEPAP